VVSAAMDSSNAAKFCDGCDHLTAGREACAGQRDRAQSSRRWYLCGNFHRTGVTGRFGNMHPGHLQRSRRTVLNWSAVGAVTEALLVVCLAIG